VRQGGCSEQRRQLPWEHEFPYRRADTVLGGRSTQEPSPTWFIVDLTSGDVVLNGPAARVGRNFEAGSTRAARRRRGRTRCGWRSTAPRASPMSPRTRPGRNTTLAFSEDALLACQLASPSIPGAGSGRGGVTPARAAVGVDDDAASSRAHNA
jgi:hypothetical protein